MKLTSKIKQAIKENLKTAILLIAWFIISSVVIPTAILYGSTAVIAKETMLKSLIEAEATILGFFGLILVYALTSFDNRIDRLQQQKFELKKKGRSLALICDQMKKVNRRKRKTIRTAFIVGVYLVLSLLLSILGLGIPNVTSALYLCIISVALFFTAIGALFLVFYDLAKSPSK